MPKFHKDIPLQVLLSCCYSCVSIFLLNGTLSPPTHFVPIQGQPHSEEKKALAPPTLVATRCHRAHSDGTAPGSVLASAKGSVTSLLLIPFDLFVNVFHFQALSGVFLISSSSSLISPLPQSKAQTPWLPCCITDDLLPQLLSSSVHPGKGCQIRAEQVCSSCPLSATSRLSSK